MRDPLTAAQSNVNMDRPVSVLRQRTKSFNPEAAAFSPVFSSPPSQDIALAPTTSPTPPQDSDYTFAMAPMFNCEHSDFSPALSASGHGTPDSPFHDVGSARSLYRRDPLTPAPVRLEDFLFPDVQALVKKLEGRWDRTSQP